MASALFTNLGLNHSRACFIQYSKIIPNTKQLQSINAANQPPVTTTSPELRIEEYRNTKIKQINRALEESIRYNQYQSIVHESMRYTLLAKASRLFSTICIAACEAVGGNESLAVPAACAMEMIVAMALILDDLPCHDNDDLRRGKLANHKVFGEGTSILASQSLFCLAVQKIASHTKNVSPDRTVRAIKEICDAIGPNGATSGQSMDLQSEGKEVSLSQLETIHRLKSGKFVEAAAVCGGIMGGGSEFEIERLRNYGMLVGLVFQVCDDIIDVTGSTEKMGKKVGRDALRDKATFVKLIGLDGSKKYARQLVAQAIEEVSYFDPTKAAPLYSIARSILSTSS